MPSLLFPILLIAFIATLVRSTFGFGESLIGVPLFSFFLPLTTAVPLSVLLSIVIALVIVIQDHHDIHFRAAGWLIIYAIIGIPIGLLLLFYGPATLIKIFLGVVIIGYSCYSLLPKTSRSINDDRSKTTLLLCGILSGILGGAYGLNGPPLVVYGNLRQWTAQQFRATLQAYFLPVSLAAFIGYLGKGLVTAQLTSYFFWSLLPVIPTIFLGRYLNSKLRDTVFFKYIYWGLAAIGIVLIVNTLR